MWLSSAGLCLRLTWRSAESRQHTRCHCNNTFCWPTQYVQLHQTCSVQQTVTSIPAPKNRCISYRQRVTITCDNYCSDFRVLKNTGSRWVLGTCFSGYYLAVILSYILRCRWFLIKTCNALVSTCNVEYRHAVDALLHHASDLVVHRICRNGW